MELLCNLLFYRDVLFWFKLTTLRSWDLLIVRTGNVVCIISSKKCFGAFRLSSKYFSVDSIRSSWAKNLTLESICWTCFSATRLSSVTVEDITFESIRIPSCKWTCWWESCFLYCFSRYTVDVENVWVLVGSSGNSGSLGLVRKDVLMNTRFEYFLTSRFLV